MRTTPTMSRLAGVFAYVGFIFTVNGLIYSGQTALREFVESISELSIGAIYVLLFFLFVFHQEVWNLVFTSSRNKSP